MNVKLQVSHNPEELSVDEAVLVYKDIDEGYTCTISDAQFKHEEFNKFIGDIEAAYGKFRVFDYSRGKTNFFKKYFGSKIRIYSRGNSLDMFASVFCKDEEDLNEVWKIYMKHKPIEDSVDMFMTSYYMNGGQVDETAKVMDSKDIQYISEKYYPYIDTEIMFDRFFTGDENILLLVGDPGLGKSKLSTLALKHAYTNDDKLPYDKLSMNPALENQYISIGYVKSTDVLANDKFWRIIEKANHDFVIIDDLDYMLTKRDSEVMSIDDAKKNDFLNQFLSFTDGVEKHKTKFIITTNQKYDDIDSALLRKGRLFDILELRELSKDEALEIWKDNSLEPDTFYQIFSHLDNIAAAELGSEIKKRLNTRIDSATAEYLKESGISKIQKATRKKKIGL